MTPKDESPASDHEVDTTTDTNPQVTSEESYSIYTRREKWFIVALTAYAYVHSLLKFET